MGRRKKTQNIEESSLALAKPKFPLGGDAKRSAVAIFLFALAILVFLSFFGKAGVVGDKLDKFSGMTIGWANFVLPLFLTAAGIVLLLRKETSFYVTKLIGFSIMFLSLVGFLHWFFETKEMLKAASSGQGGGYLGYAISYLLTKYMGEFGSVVLILAIFIIGTIVAFNFSLINLISYLKSKLEKKEETENPEEEAMILPEEKPLGEDRFMLEETPQIILPEEKVEDSEEEEADRKNNIGKIKFVEGPDQFVDESLLAETKISKKEEKFTKHKLVKNQLPGYKNKKWIFPGMDLLENGSDVAKGGDVEKNAEIIEKTLRYFGIEVERGEIKTGPAVTQYSFRPAVGIKISKILALQNDLALALAAHPIRIEAPIPGKSLIGIEVPNKVSATVRLKNIFESHDFKHRRSNLTIALGEDVSGNYIFGSLDKMPHLMIAGATGTGKSVCVNSIILSLLYQNSPEDLKFIMVDPKRVELTLYNGIPHLKTDVIVDNAKVINALKWAVGEMERRYRLLQDTGSRDIISYREKISSGKKRKYTDPETGEIVEEELENFPYLVIIIDELADLMGTHGKEVEGVIVRIAQMARAVGIHLIISTQRPSVEVITGLIKANITTRISLQVASQIDSRTILDMAGAEKLLGRGDLLYLSASSPKPVRVQGVYVTEGEVKKVVKFIKNQKKEAEEIGEDITNTKAPVRDEILEFKDSSPGQDDDMYALAKDVVVKSKKASASLLQRRLRVGYARAARILDLLEENGIIGPADGAKPREVYLTETGEDTNITYENGAEDQEKREKWQV